MKCLKPTVGLIRGYVTCHCVFNNRKLITLHFKGVGYVKIRTGAYFYIFL